MNILYNNFLLDVSVNSYNNFKILLQKNNKFIFQHYFAKSRKRVPSFFVEEVMRNILDGGESNAKTELDSAALPVIDYWCCQ